MSTHRTSTQRTANDLDLEMFRLIDHLRDFSVRVPDRDAAKLRDAASALSMARGPVRSLMHPDDQRSTK